MDPTDHSSSKKPQVTVKRRQLPQPGCKRREQVISDIKECIKPNLEDVRRQLIKHLEALLPNSSSGGGAARLEGLAVSLIATFVEGPTESAKVNFIPVHQDVVEYQQLVLTCGDEYQADSDQGQHKRALNDMLSGTKWRRSNDTKLQKVGVNERMDKKGGREKTNRNTPSSSSK